MNVQLLNILATICNSHEHQDEIMHRMLNEHFMVESIGVQLKMSLNTPSNDNIKNMV